jgi:hypothetical protein
MVMGVETDGKVDYGCDAVSVEELGSSDSRALEDGRR